MLLPLTWRGGGSRVGSAYAEDPPEVPARHRLRPREERAVALHEGRLAQVGALAPAAAVRTRRGDQPDVSSDFGRRAGGESGRAAAPEGARLLRLHTLLAKTSPKPTAPRSSWRSTSSSSRRE